MEYTLKDKIPVTKEFLEELTNKGWQDIEHLQAQIANIDNIEENTKLIQLFKNLLTSYYIFVGGLENLDSENITVKKLELAKEPTVIEMPAEKTTRDTEMAKDPLLDTIVFDEPIKKATSDDIEPFEYFVDFDEPVGDPWTDDDLYKN